MGSESVPSAASTQGVGWGSAVFFFSPSSGLKLRKKIGWLVLVGYPRWLLEWWLSLTTRVTPYSTPSDVGFLEVGKSSWQLRCYDDWCWLDTKFYSSRTWPQFIKVGHLFFLYIWLPNSSLESWKVGKLTMPIGISQVPSFVSWNHGPAVWGWLPAQGQGQRRKRKEGEEQKQGQVSCRGCDSSRCRWYWWIPVIFPWD